VTRREQLREFLTWVTGKASQAELEGSSGRSFRRRTAWCWELRPRIPVTGEFHHAVLVDGIWIGDWCLLITLSDTGSVLGWQWSGGESTAAWQALFEQVPAPAVIVTDGGTGIRSALANAWPETKIQRCIFHLQMNVTRELTRNPRLPAGRALRAIAMQLSEVYDVDAAVAWRLRLEEWWQAFGYLTKERSLYENGQFGFTHKRLRDAWHILTRVAHNGHAFTFLDYGNPRTTSAIEGGINAQIRHLLRHHRGMPLEHRRRAVEWFLLLREIPLERALAHANQPAQSPPAITTPEPDEPPLYDTSLSPDEGLWHRSGWLRNR
jgi:hypothetical protein